MCQHTPFLPIITAYMINKIQKIHLINQIDITRTTRSDNPLASSCIFSSASTWARAVSRTSTHEPDFDSEKASLVFGESATTISYHICNEVFKDEGDVIGWMAGLIFTEYQNTLVCLDDIIAHPEHLLFDH